MLILILIAHNKKLLKHQNNFHQKEFQIHQKHHKKFHFFSKMII